MRGWLFLALWLVLGASQGDWSLFRGLHHGGRLELWAEDGALRALLERRVAARRGALPLELVLVADPAEGRRGAPRVVLARVGGPGSERAARLLRGTPVTLAADGFAVGGRSWSEERDACALTREDPERPGRPLTVIVGGARAPLAALASLESPVWRPGLRVWRAGRLVASDAQRAAAEQAPEGPALILRTPLVELRGPATIERERAAAYAERLAAAAARVHRWLGVADGPARALPVDLCDETQAALAGGALARTFDGDDGVLALLAPDVRDDGGAAFALACALAAGGEPAGLWLRDAVGPAAAGAWWGRALEEWVAHLAAADLGLSVAELVDPRAASRHSLHRLAPLRAFLLLTLLADGEDLASLWRAGLPAERLPALEARLGERLAQARAAHADAAGAGRRASALGLRGFATARPAGSSRAALAWTREQGADALALDVLVPIDGLPYGVARPVGAEAGFSDAELLIALDVGRALGLAGALVIEPLSAPGGLRADQVARTRAEDWAGFFDAFEPAALHYALLAELAGCELFCFGVGLERATDVDSLAGDPRKREIKRARLERLTGALRAAFGGSLCYAGGSPAELRRLSFVERLDVLGLTLFPGLRTEREPELYLFRDLLRHHLRSLEEVSAELGRPIVLVQAGFPSSEGAAGTPDRPTPRVESSAQALYYEALAEVLAEEDRQRSWLAGLFLWELGGPARGEGAADWGYDPRGKPAEAFVSRILAR